MKQGQNLVNKIWGNDFRRFVVVLLRGVIVTGGMQNHKGDFAGIAGKAEMAGFRRVCGSAARAFKQRMNSRAGSIGVIWTRGQETCPPYGSAAALNTA